METGTVISHQPRVSIFTATDEEMRNGGAGMEVRWGVSESAFGKMFLAASPRGITHLSFFDGDQGESLDVLRGDWPAAELVRDDGFANGFGERAFSEKPAGEFRLHVKGTPFQRKVWEALLGIPPGELSTYGELAEEIGMAGGSRAVGNAVGRNRISYLIPCHRVIRASGELGGYRWGSDRKRAMLEREGVLPLIRP